MGERWVVTDAGKAAVMRHLENIIDPKTGPRPSARRLASAMKMMRKAKKLGWKSTAETARDAEQAEATSDRILHA